MKASKALSIALNPPKTFAGRKVGALVTDGTDLSLVEALKQALDAEGATLEIVAPTIGGVESNDGRRIEANQKIGGGPSVLYDAVAILPSKEGADLLLINASAKDFISDAFGHLKFIAFVKSALPLFQKAGLPENLDEGFVELSGTKSVAQFVQACRKLRLWQREQTVIT